LRDAITAANTNIATGDCPAGTAGLDTIGFSLGNQCNLIPCKIPLTGTLPIVTEDLTINGSNATISGEHLFRVFNLGAVTVNISNLTIANGNVSDTGGAIHMSDAVNPPGTTLSLTHVFFSGNHANIGGAIYEPRGTLTVINSNFSGNTAVTDGGAIDGSTLRVVDSVFSNNTAGDDGGALVLFSDATISVSTFSGNAAATGGAIVKVVLGNLQLIDSVFDNNAATSAITGGGAIYAAQNTGQVTLTNVTISGNSAKNNGGGVRASVVPLNLNNVTMINNLADSDNDDNGDGGGVFKDIGTVQIQNSIIAGNFDTPSNAGGGLKMPDCRGAFSSRGYNLIGRNDNAVCGGLVNGVNADQVGSAANPIDPLLAALANNGGSTQTHALLPGSSALNAGNPLAPGSGGLACPASDQRGIVRPQGSACDIGAFEFEYRSLYLPLILR